MKRKKGSIISNDKNMEEENFKEYKTIIPFCSSNGRNQ